MAAFYDLGVMVAGLPGTSAMLHPAKEDDMLLHGRWKELIPREQWSVFRRVLEEARAKKLDFAFGGAFAVATYTGKWRDTKDMDLYILPGDREEMKAALAAAGLTDYFPVKDYDRSWIYRAHTGDVIVDCIWSMANHRTDVDRAWLTRGPVVEFGGENVHVVPPEELIWSKLYVLQRDRCDWPDVLNIVHAIGPELDWERLFHRLNSDAPLLDGILSVFRWLVPDRAAQLPSWLWKRKRKKPRLPAGCERVRLLDTRPWFRPLEAAADREKEPSAEC